VFYRRCYIEVFPEAGFGNHARRVAADRAGTLRFEDVVVVENEPGWRTLDVPAIGGELSVIFAAAVERFGELEGAHG
jgi:hypothetical protein